MKSLQEMKTNLLWTETVAVSVADPALLLAVQETCKVIIIVYFILPSLLSKSICKHCWHLKLLMPLWHCNQQ